MLLDKGYCFTILIIMTALTGTISAQKKTTVTKSQFGRTPDGTAVEAVLAQ